MSDFLPPGYYWELGGMVLGHGHKVQKCKFPVKKSKFKKFKKFPCSYFPCAQSNRAACEMGQTAKPCLGLHCHMHYHIFCFALQDMTHGTTLSNDLWIEVCDFVGAGNARRCNSLIRVCRSLWELLHKRHQYGIKRHHMRQWVGWCGNQVSTHCHQAP